MKISIITLLVVFFILLLIGIPIMFSMGLTSLTVLITQGSRALLAIPQRMFSSLDIFTYMSIPLFILASEIMSRCDLMEGLVNFCNAFIGHFKGGLALVNVLGSMLFAGVSGSASADTTGLGRVEIDLMTRAGYDKVYSTTVTVASSIIGPIIPPSNIFIIYAAVTGRVSIAAMFLAGVIPGLLLGIVEMILCYRYAVKYNHPVGERSNWRQRFQATKEALPILVLPLIIMGGIVSGIFTATESAAIAVVYAIFIAVARKKMNFKVLIECSISAAKTTASILLIIAVASLMGYAITVMRLPQQAIEWALAYISNKYIFLLFVNILLLMLGAVLDQSPALLLVAPILVPVANAFGIDSVHFGLIVCFNLTLGLISPPVGMQLFIGANVANVELTKLYRSILPFFIVGIIVLILITYIPITVTFLPTLFGY